MAATLAAATATRAAPPQKPLEIGVSFGTLQEERWEAERERMVERGKTLGVTVLYADANHDANLQNSQIENLISKGIKVLVVGPQDIAAAAVGVAAAKKAGIPVISYVRLVDSKDLDVFIGYDFEAIGRTVAQYALKQVPKGNYVLMNGHDADSVPHEENTGYKEALKDAVAKGDVKVVFDQYMNNWSPQEALANMENVLTKTDNNVQAVLSNNDGMAGGVSQALDAQKLSGKVFLGGMDGDLAACQRIVEGKETMTVFIGHDPLADAILDAAIQLANGEKPKAINASVNTKFGPLPAIYIAPAVVDKSNIDEVMIKSGVRKVEDVYKNIPRSDWPK
jgi:D-xylose transport system substrate-binding protein